MKLRITEKSNLREVLQMFEQIRNDYPESSSIYQNAKVAFGVYIAEANRKAVEGK